MKKIFLVLLTAISVLSGCKKNDTPAAPPSLLGKWDVVNLRYTETDQGMVVYDDNYVGVTGDYMEFKSDNKVVVYVRGSGAIEDYELLPNNRVLIDTEIYTIQQLTSTNARLYMKYDWAPGEYSEQVINLKR